MTLCETELLLPATWNVVPAWLAAGEPWTRECSWGALDLGMQLDSVFSEQQLPCPHECSLKAAG